MSVFVACPNYGMYSPETVISLINAARVTPQLDVQFKRSSLLTMNCNVLWCQALNDRPKVTHFIMLHSDIAPTSPNWILALVEEQQRCGADVLSVVAPVKDGRGVSSTAVVDTATGKFIRLTMTQLAALPATFDSTTAGYPGKALLVNTGLFICDFTKPWVEELWFSMHDHITCNNGVWEAMNFPEDWTFSLKCVQMGLKVCATKCLAVRHYGRKEYRNDEVWGEAIDPNNKL